MAPGSSHGGDHCIQAEAGPVWELGSGSRNGFVWVRGSLFNLGGSWGLVVLFCCHPTPFPSLSSFYTAWLLREGWERLERAAAHRHGDGARY